MISGQKKTNSTSKVELTVRMSLDHKVFQLLKRMFNNFSYEIIMYFINYKSANCVKVRK